MQIDFETKVLSGKVGEHEFEALVNGTLICERVPDVVRDEMRIAAAEAFLSSARNLKLEKEERAYWSGVLFQDKDHKFFVEREKRGRKHEEE